MQSSALVQVAKNTVAETVAYRVSFVLYRLRNIIQFLTAYYLWLAILPPGKSFAGYDMSTMLTYIFGAALVSSIVMSSRSQAIGEEINNGTLSAYLLRPMNYFSFWLARDVGDKVMNVVFGILEVTFLYLVFRPPLAIQTDPFYLLTFLLAVVIGMFNYFFISIALGLIGFWSNDIWAPRFIFYSLMIFFSGGIFPLDLLPEPIYLFFQALPFPYLLYFPVKVYLGQMSVQEVFIGLLIGIVWVGILYKLVNYVWSLGLKAYTAYGR